MIRAKESDPGGLGNDPPAARWLVVRYRPTALFSLKLSSATSSVGKTLVVPTPYAIKMALIDAAFRGGFSDAECSRLLEALRDVEVRIRPPGRAVVTHTFVKVRQESRGEDPDHPYTSNIAYREVVHHRGEWGWAFDLGGNPGLEASITALAPLINQIGKRGSFIQFAGFTRLDALDETFTLPLPREGDWALPERCHIRPLDDFGPEADLETLSSFSARRASRDRHRKFVETLIPLGVSNAGPGFSMYES